MNFPGRRTLLIVDDDPAVRKVIEGYFTSDAYEVLVAANGSEALDIASHREIDVVLLDVIMPGLSGVDVLKQLRIDSPHTAVIMVTAMAEVEFAVVAMKLGAYDYVTKPFRLDDLRSRLEGVLKRRDLALQQEFHQRDT